MFVVHIDDDFRRFRKKHGTSGSPIKLRSCIPTSHLKVAKLPNTSQVSTMPENSAQAISSCTTTPNALKPENRIEASEKEPVSITSSGTEIGPGKVGPESHQDGGAHEDLDHFKEINASFQIAPEGSPEERDTDPPMTSQGITRDSEKEDAVHEHAAEQDTNSSSPLPSTADAAISSEATKITLFCSPMGTSDRGHEETSIYAIPDFLAIDKNLEGESPSYLILAGPQTSLPDLNINFLAEEGVKNSGAECRPKSPEFSLETFQPSSPLVREDCLRSSSPPTSSPPPISSRPSSPMDDTDWVIPGLSLTDLPNTTSSGPKNSPGRGVSEDSLSPPRNGVVMVVSDTKFELGRLVQKEQRKAVYHLPPNPKRPTPAAQRRQHEKLSKPFRPPCLVHPKAEDSRLLPASDTQRMETEDVKNDERVISQTMLRPGEAKDPQGVGKGGRSKNRTTKAGAQFKSPLISGTGTGTGGTSHHSDSAVRLTPTIQMLERKLQHLKRAIKIKEDDQEDKLRGLITKWTEAGREIAWEVWAIVKDNNTDEEHSGITGKRTLQHLRDWEMRADKRHKGEEEFCGFSETVDNEVEGTDNMESMKESAEDEDPERPHNTLGTMLRQFRIDPQTLGWDDEEEAFKDIGGED